MEKTGLKLTNLTDAQLVDLALEQNQAAYSVLYERYNNGVSAHIARYTKQQEDIEDICIESFQKAFSQLVSYNKEYKFSTWLYRIARNTAFDHKSHKDREKSNIITESDQDLNVNVNEIPAVMQNPEDEIIKQQESEKLIANIDKLKEDYRIVTQMNLIDKFGYKEISDKLGLPINTVKTRIRRAKALLLKMMDISDEIA